MIAEKSPLLPLRVVTDRNRGGVYLSLGLAVIAMFGVFLFLTYYLQVVKGYSPVLTGVAFLPMITGSTQIGAQLMTRVPARWLIGPGSLLASTGMLLLAQMRVDSSYPALILPAQLLLGLGMGTAFMPAMSLATDDVETRDAGVASAMVNTSQQVGGSIGTALLNTIAASATTSWLAAHQHNPALINQAAVHGYSTAAWWAAGILVLSSLIAITFLNAGRPSPAPVASGDGVSVEDAPVPVISPLIAHSAERTDRSRRRPRTPVVRGRRAFPPRRSVELFGLADLVGELRLCRLAEVARTSGRLAVERGVGHRAPVGSGERFGHLSRRLVHVPEDRQPSPWTQHTCRLHGVDDRIYPVPRLGGDDRVGRPGGRLPGLEGRPTSTSRPRTRAKSAIRASGSTPSTAQPAAWNWRAAMPVPQPTSSTSDPGLPATIRATNASG